MRNPGATRADADSGRRRPRSAAARPGGCSKGVPSSSSRLIACRRRSIWTAGSPPPWSELIEPIAVGAVNLAEHEIDHLIGFHGVTLPRNASPTAPSAGASRARHASVTSRFPPGSSRSRRSPDISNPGDKPEPRFGGVRLVGERYTHGPTAAARLPGARPEVRSIRPRGDRSGSRHPTRRPPPTR